MLGKIKKFFGFSDKNDVKSDEKSLKDDKIQELQAKIENLSSEVDKKDENHEEMKDLLLGDIRDSGLKEQYIDETVGEYHKRKAKQRQRVKNEIKAVVDIRMTINDLYMMERFGIKMKKRGSMFYPNFMATNFSGFLVGKCVETNKMVVFAGVTDVNDRKFQLNGRVISYNLIMRYLSSGKIHHGYKWFRVKNDEILRGMYENGEFVDDASRIWLGDYFNYLAFVEKYKADNPEVKTEIDEIKVFSK